jgi:very-short-patch-repair endonuclease
VLDKTLLHRQIQKLASRQWGHVTRLQLLELGVPRQTITGWVRRGLLVRVHAGVYALGHAERNSWARAAAAVLAGGPGAFLSRASTLALFELRPWPRIPEISSPRCCRRPGIRHHRTPALTPQDTRRHLNIPTTTVVRAILDVSARLTDRQLVRMVQDARLAGAVSAPQLERLLERSRRIAGLIDPAAGPTRSGFEDDFVAYCRHHRLPTPITNATVAGYEVDALFAEHRVIVEIDGWRYHHSRRSFAADRQRDLATTAAGHITIRIPDEGLTDQTATQLRRVLAQRAAGA